MEERLNLVIYADTQEEPIPLKDVRIDRTLQECIISKALVNRLGLEGKYNVTPSKIIKDAEGKAHSIIGDVHLKWHRPESRKTRPQKFLVVDSMSEIIILSADAHPKAKELDVHTLGLEKQTDGMPFQELPQCLQSK